MKNDKPEFSVEDLMKELGVKPKAPKCDECDERDSCAGVEEDDDCWADECIVGEQMEEVLGKMTVLFELGMQTHSEVERINKVTSAMLQLLARLEQRLNKELH